MAATRTSALISLLLFPVLLGCPTSPAPAHRALPAQLWGLQLERLDPVNGVEIAYHRSADVVLELQAVLLDQALAKQLSDERSRVFASLFEIKRTGYPGQQTSFLECPAAYQPEHVQRSLADGGFVDAWISWANGNRVPGACAEDLARHRAVTAQLYCPSIGALWRIDWSVPRNERAENRARTFVTQLGCDSL